MMDYTINLIALMVITRIILPILPIIPTLPLLTASTTANTTDITATNPLIGRTTRDRTDNYFKDARTAQRQRTILKPLKVNAVNNRMHIRLKYVMLSEL